MQKNMSGSLGGVIDDMLSGSVAGNIQFESSGGSTVTITPTLESGTKIADFSIDDVAGVLYAPTPEQPIEYTAGANIQISEENVISATDTTYTAGNNITIDNGVISAIGGSSLNYSTTEEVVVGTWFDGRPIYQKVWDNLNINVTANNWTNTITITDGIDVVDCKAWGAFGNDYFLIVPTQAHIKSDNEGLLEIWAPSNRTVLRMMVQYTKTTD